MAIDRLNFDTVSEGDLDELIAAGTPEGLAIEYKRDAYGNSDADKSEALKDISALANSAGGTIVIGMEADRGIATRLTGLPSINADAEVLRLESMAQNGIEPRIIGIRIRQIPLSRGGSAIILRVPQSWNPPHRVSARGSNRYFLRNSGGVHEAGLEELRGLFTRAGSVAERVRNFRVDRLSIISQQLGPVPLAGAGHLVLHLAPMASFSQSMQIDLPAVYQAHASFGPLGYGGMTPIYNFDGIVNLRGGDVCRGYTQVFRSGAVEATKSGVVHRENELSVVRSGEVGDNIFQALPRYLDALSGLGVPCPIFILVSLLGVRADPESY